MAVQRRGAHCALLADRGFRDAVERELETGAGRAHLQGRMANSMQVASRGDAGASRPRGAADRRGRRAKPGAHPLDFTLDLALAEDLRHDVRRRTRAQRRGGGCAACSPIPNAHHLALRRRRPSHLPLRRGLRPPPARSLEPRLRRTGAARGRATAHRAAGRAVRDHRPRAEARRAGRRPDALRPRDRRPRPEAEGPRPARRRAALHHPGARAARRVGERIAHRRCARPTRRPAPRGTGSAQLRGRAARAASAASPRGRQPRARSLGRGYRRARAGSRRRQRGCAARAAGSSSSAPIAAATLSGVQSSCSSSGTSAGPRSGSASPRAETWIIRRASQRAERVDRDRSPPSAGRTTASSSVAVPDVVSAASAAASAARFSAGSRSENGRCGPDRTAAATASAVPATTGTTTRSGRARARIRSSAAP